MGIHLIKPHSTHNVMTLTVLNYKMIYLTFINCPTYQSRIKMLLRALFISFICTLFLGCASSTNSNSLYSLEDVNAIKGKHWLAMNLKREGVKATDSGLQYKVLKQSTGCNPDPDYRVTVHYTMMLAESKKVIDSSYQRGNPDKFELSKMIKGWREGVPMMKVGEIWELYIPSDLAYGSRGLSGSVGPNSALVSQITLIDARCQE